MHWFTQNWSFDPFVIGVVAVVAIHAMGLRRHLRAIRRAGRPTAPWLGQAALFYAGLGALLLAVVSPVDYWSETYLTAHIIQHLFLAFIAPPLVVLGAPWVPLLLGLPPVVRRGYAKVLHLTRPERPPVISTGRFLPPARSSGWLLAARIRAFAAQPLVAVILFNVNMVFWHLTGPFQLAAQNQYVHIWLAHGSFFGLGVAMWLQIFGSYPFRPVMIRPRRIASLIATNAVMVLIAMTLVLFTKHLYESYAFRGAVAQANDQQLAGGILWVCGEVTFLPSILFLVVQWLTEREAIQEELARVPTIDFS